MVTVTVVMPPLSRYETHGRAALRAIAAHIQTVPDAQFNMGCWFHKTHCGTVGCAIGHSFDLPEVIHAELYRNRYSYPCFEDAGEEIEAFEGIAMAFGITDDDAHHLFGALNYSDGVSQYEVAARIYKYLLEH